jgi:hypothetical protein
MAHAQKPDFFFRRKGRFHLNRQGRQFGRILAAEVCSSTVLMLDTPCSHVAWRVLATHSIRQFPLHFPSRASPCAITFQLDSTTLRFAVKAVPDNGLVTIKCYIVSWRTAVLVFELLDVTCHISWIKGGQTCNSCQTRLLLNTYKTHASYDPPNTCASQYVKCLKLGPLCTTRKVYPQPGKTGLTGLFLPKCSSTKSLR